MKHDMWHNGFVVVLLGIALISSMTACNVFKKKVPPNELFSNAEEHRKFEKFVEAAQSYDQLINDYPDSELIPAALYFSGLCKYTLSLRAPGEQEFKQRQEGLSEQKKEAYEGWLEYMKDDTEAFSYVEALDTFVYQGGEFKRVVDEFPASNLVDDAAFQLIRLHIKAKQTTNTLTLDYAFNLYAEFFTTYSQSQYRPKCLEHLVQLVSEPSGTLLNHDAIVTAFQEFSQAAQNFADLGKLAYLLAVEFLEKEDLNNAAAVLGVPDVMGLGIVETERTRLNIRSGQGTNYRIVTKADKGEHVILLDYSGQWYHMYLHDGIVGYAHGDFIRPYHQ